MRCNDFQEIIDSYLSDELLTETNHEILRHMEDCVDCRRVIEARREIRTRLRNAVLESEKYQIDKDFEIDLCSRVMNESLRVDEPNKSARFGFGSWAAIAAGLILTFTLGAIFISNFVTSDGTDVVDSSHLDKSLPTEHAVNIAFGDHQFCAIKRNSLEPVKGATLSSRFDKLEGIALPSLEKSFVNSKFKASHTCEYRGTKFRHLVLEREGEIVSVMLTEKSKAEKFGKDISYFSSEKYQLARFDLRDTSVFVVSGLDKKTNSEAAGAIYKPLQKYVESTNSVQTALLMVY